MTAVILPASSLVPKYAMPVALLSGCGNPCSAVLTSTPVPAATRPLAKRFSTSSNFCPTSRAFACIACGRYCAMSQGAPSPPHKMAVQNDSYQHHPLLIEQHTKASDDTSYIMKRLSKENLRAQGRKLGKLAHCSPGPVFDRILDQLQVGVIVECNVRLWCWEQHWGLSLLL